MYHEDRFEQTVSNKSQAQDRDSPIVSVNSAGTPSQQTSSSSRAQGRFSRSPPGGDSINRSALVPSSPLSTTRKSIVELAEEQDVEQDRSPEAASGRVRRSSNDSGIHVCICQPDPKIPRPRNAFILYRQHHQASVIAQHPGLANPEISKIIGEQWQNQPPEVKNKWKALAEEEKIRHQHLYPTYRYQPKRSTQRPSVNAESGEKSRCSKCGGRSILGPLTPVSSAHTNNPNPPADPHTPQSGITPVTRTLPVLRDLTLQTPGSGHSGKQFPSSMMSPKHYLDGRDEFGHIDAVVKRRRFDGDPSPQTARAMMTRYVNAPMAPPGQPGTPFPFGPPTIHPHPPGATGARHESFPGLQGMGSPPGPMGPPPRPGLGYQQHRVAQGHTPHDRSLTLPPLQTSSASKVPPALASSATSRSAVEQIMSMDFRSKIRTLRRVAPPAPVRKNALRGPFLSVEGDNLKAVEDLGSWLEETLHKADDFHVRLLEGPELPANDDKGLMMARYHRLAADWLEKTETIRDSLAIRINSSPDSVMVDSDRAALRRKVSRRIDENYDDSDESSSGLEQTVDATTADQDKKGSRSESEGTEEMEVDSAVQSSGSSVKEATIVPSSATSNSAKPVSIIANYSLRASNYFACHIPVSTHDPYAPGDHWQWTATQWRNIISPDLIIYVRDTMTGDNGKQSVDILDEGNLFVVKRTKVDGKEVLEIEPSTLRRLGFEVSEWVRAFGSNAE